MWRFPRPWSYDKKTVVLSILGTYFNGIVLDHFIFDNSIKRRVCIITEKEEALRQFILHDLHSGATMYEAIGAYNLEKHNEIITIVDKSEYQKLMNFINREDPKAFCYHLQCIQHAVSAQDLIGGELPQRAGLLRLALCHSCVVYSSPERSKRMEGKSMLTYTYVSEGPLT